MSDEIPIILSETSADGQPPAVQEKVVPAPVRIDPNEEITPEKKIILLNQWREKVEAEVNEYTAEREKIMAAYRAQKEKFDKILLVKLKKVKKIDTIMNGRKKVLADIIREITIASTPPTE